MVLKSGRVATLVNEIALPLILKKLQIVNFYKVPLDKKGQLEKFSFSCTNIAAKNFTSESLKLNELCLNENWLLWLGTMY